MKKILIFGAFLGGLACASAFSAARDDAAVANRAKQTRNTTTTARTAINPETRNVASTRTNVTQTRAGTMRTGVAARTTTGQVKTVRTNRTPSSTRSAYVPIYKRVSLKPTARAAKTTETRTGAEYNQCKTAYFQCMDQFCTLKNDDYRRCSCSSRIYDLIAARNNLTDTSAKLTEFTENLDIVGMTAEQATAIRTASDGENALTADTSASKALLTAIMNSIRGEDATVGGKMSNLNSIDLSFDTNIGFGATDNAQLIASYNGPELYNAVYSSCRAIVKDDCNDAALQRAVTAYLMAIEQDCNTVQTALGNKQTELKAAIREGGAMLDLARVENRKKHNSDDKATCIANIEAAILDEQVCGAGYHKCLDDGKFIDITTGAPIAGVVNFYELANMLSFSTGLSAADQKLAQNPNNRTFVKNFETKTKKFAMDALDKCTEIADSVWQDYLDRALLDIYYAQQAKVETIKTGCFDLISSCYQDREASITAAMASLIDGTTEIMLQPDKIVLTNQMCTDYIESCNNMFGNNIITEYIAKQTQTDTLSACRAIAEQCFTRFGGANYENFYNPSSSGLFEPNTVDTLTATNPTINSALDWFTLYEYDENGIRQATYVSECAKQLAAMPNCAPQIEEIFGGLDKIIAEQELNWDGTYNYTKPNSNKAHAYGWARRDGQGSIDWNEQDYEFKNRRLRPTGVATEIYNRIIDNLTTQCLNIDGKFIEAQSIDHKRYGTTDGNVCVLTTSYNFQNYNIFRYYGLYEENVCPKDYSLNTDTHAWGACLCWENGGRRSKYGLFTKCIAGHPITDESGVSPSANVPYSARPRDRKCEDMYIAGAMLLATGWGQSGLVGIDWWCTSTVEPNTNRVCPFPSQNQSCDTIPNELPWGNGVLKQD